jgi:hypothetical protein
MVLKKIQVLNLFSILDVHYFNNERAICWYSEEDKNPWISNDYDLGKKAKNDSIPKLLHFEMGYDKSNKRNKLL